MYHGDIKLHVFVFLMRVCLFIATGVVLHATHATPSFFVECRGIWESMLLILSLKCIRIAICNVVLHRFRMKANANIDKSANVAFFVIECVVTSCSQNSKACVTVMQSPFDGHPMIAYVNILSCVWDGCMVLSVALHTAVDRFDH